MCYLARAARLRAPSLPPLLFLPLFSLLPLPPFGVCVSSTHTHVHPGGGINSLADIHPRSQPPLASPRHATVSSLSTPLDIYIVCRSSRGWKKKVARPLSSPCRVKQKDSLFSSSTPSVNLRAALVWGRFRAGVEKGFFSFRLLNGGQDSGLCLFRILYGHCNDYFDFYDCFFFILFRLIFDFKTRLR